MEEKGARDIVGKSVVRRDLLSALKNVFVCSIKALKILFVFSALFALASCSDDPSNAPPEFVDAPIITPSSHPAAQLAALIEFSANKPSRATYDVEVDGESWRYQSADYIYQHKQPLIRFKPNQMHRVTITLQDDKGRESEHSDPIFFTPDVSVTLPLVENIEVRSSVATNGIKLLSLSRQIETTLNNGELFLVPDLNYGLLVALDASNDIVWFYQTDYLIRHVEQDAEDMLTLVGHLGRETVDTLGNRLGLVRGLRQGGGEPENVTVVTTDDLHSKSVRLPSGNRLVLSSEMRILNDYPSAPGNSSEPIVLSQANMANSPVDHHLNESRVVGDIVLEISPEGEVIDRWNLFDLIDYQRATYNSHNPSHQTSYLGAKAWTRANSLAYLPETDTLLVSLQHQDALLGIDKIHHNVKWILGDSEGWGSDVPVLKQQGSGGQIYFPSSLRLEVSGDLWIVDNGGYRAIPPNTPGSLFNSNPRLVKLSINEQDLTYRVVEEFPVKQRTDSESREWRSQQNIAYDFPAGENQIVFARSSSSDLSYLSNQDGQEQRLFTLKTTEHSAPGGNLYQWAIEDVIIPEHFAPPGNYRWLIDSRQPLRVVANNETVLNEAAGAVEQPDLDASNDRWKPNVDARNGSIEGRWQLKTQSENGDISGERTLVLKQDGNLLSGALDDLPIAGWVKGNTFSLTTRQYGSNGQVRFRYRGVIGELDEQIRGTTKIDQQGRALGEFQWFAERS